MFNPPITPAFKQDQILARFSEVEAMVDLLQRYAETQYNDPTLDNGFKILSEGVLIDLYRAINLEHNQADSKAEVSND
ncbi:hypothetical protein [Avibacterium sp. 21-599]|uniref:hypothetical protein n=1 Tax=Avibacterium sp. 21-599 TaxID=2911528 RepID=UPI0022478685|nr:hypothetical protein [Avibacterium sp. 21-599]MCW9718950.1 hypothetical protein [Avibacterium sp. 21-599]